MAASEYHDDVLVLTDELNEQDSIENVRTYSNGGENRSAWNWPDDTEGSVFLQGCSVIGSSLYVAGVTDDPLGKRVVAKIDGDGSVAWQHTSESNIYSDARLVSTGDSTLVLVGVRTTGHSNWTEVVGFDTDAQAILWETGTLSGDVVATGTASFGDGAIIVGYEHGSAFRGWVARLTASGDIAWERRYPREFLTSISDVTVSESGEIVLIGFGREDRENHRRLLALSADGGRRWTHRDDLSIDDPEMGISEAENGFLVGTTSFDDPLHVYRTDDRGRNQSHVAVDPFEDGFDLSEVVCVDDGYVLAGGAGEYGPGRRAWLTYVDANRKTKTSTATRTPTRTPTASQAETPTGTPEQNTELSAIQTQTRSDGDGDETSSTSGRGDGFGFGVAGLSLLSAGILSRINTWHDE